MPVTSVYRIGGGTSITTDNSSSLAAQSAANGALSSTLSNAGVTLTGAGLGVSTGLNVTGSTTLTGVTATGFVSLSGSTQSGIDSLVAGTKTITGIGGITANAIVIATTRGQVIGSTTALSVTSIVPGTGFTVNGATSSTAQFNWFIAKL